MKHFAIFATPLLLVLGCSKNEPAPQPEKAATVGQRATVSTGATGATGAAGATGATSAQPAVAASAAPTVAPAKFDGVECNASFDTTKILARFDFASMKGSFTVDGAATRRLAFAAQPFKGTYSLTFENAEAGDKAPPGEKLVAKKSILARLVTIGAEEQIHFDGDLKVPGLPAKPLTCTGPAATALTSATTPQAKTVDSPAWADGAKGPIKVGFAVYPSRPDPKRPDAPEWALRKVEASVRIGDVVRKIPLTPQPGLFVPAMQGVCATKGGASLSGITFSKGDSYTFKRSGNGALQIAATFQSDGHCPEPCAKPKETIVAEIPVPAGLTEYESRVIMVEGPGKEHPLNCKADFE